MIPNIKDINLAMNQLESFSTIYPQLEFLDISNNQLIDLNIDSSKLQNLNRLDLSNNNLTGIPPELGLLNLNVLNITGNPIRNIPKEVWKTTALLAWLRTRLPVPNSSSKMETKISESNVSIASSIPVKADMSKQGLNDFPDQCQNCIELDLSQNYIRTFPSDCFPNLTILNMTRNQISQLPSCLETVFPNLEHLNLSFNLLKGVFSTKLPGISVLILTSNQIQRIDPTCLPSKLQTLDISNNSLELLPPELGNLSQLTVLKVEGNIFRSPRQSIVQGGSSSVLRWLRNIRH